MSCRRHWGMTVCFMEPSSWPLGVKVNEMTFAEAYKAQCVQALDSEDLSKVHMAIDWMKQARADGQTIFTCGNGGSAAKPSPFLRDMRKGVSCNEDTTLRLVALT